MNRKTDWEVAWNSYRKIDVRSRDDLFFQVGKTIGGKKIADDIFELIVNKITHYLNIGAGDVVYDLCCGNGLVTHELSRYAAKVVGIDFSTHLIDAARKHRSAPNVTYLIGEVSSVLDREVLQECMSPKFLLGDALGYFTVSSFEKLVHIIEAKTADAMLPLKLLVTGVPDDALKWNFYNTEERRIEYLKQKDDDFNGCIGRWWRREELADIAEKHGLTIEFHDTDPAESIFRFDCLVQTAPRA